MDSGVMRLMLVLRVLILIIMVFPFLHDGIVLSGVTLDRERSPINLTGSKEGRGINLVLSSLIWSGQGREGKETDSEGEEG
jgi:hypothetical protein